MRERDEAGESGLFLISASLIHRNTDSFQRRHVDLTLNYSLLYCIKAFFPPAAVSGSASSPPLSPFQHVRHW